MVSQSHVQHVLQENLLTVIHFKSSTRHIDFNLLKVIHYMFQPIRSSWGVLNYKYYNIIIDFRLMNPHIIFTRERARIIMTELLCGLLYQGTDLLCYSFLMTHLTISGHIGHQLHAATCCSRLPVAVGSVYITDSGKHCWYGGRFPHWKLLFSNNGTSEFLWLWTGEPPP
jgi:hypothetical protein